MLAQPTVSSLVDVYAENAFFRPGEQVTLRVQAQAGARVEARVMHLAGRVAELSADLVDGRALLTWTPPADAVPRGYGLDLRLLAADGRLLAETSTAFDVLERWTQAPRYGFLSEFRPGRNNADETAAWAARYHLNGLQFYDWQYRHEQLMPPAGSDVYTDVLGRQLSLRVVKALIAAVHARNIAAMPYTAIYGASVAFHRQHPDWALFQLKDVPYTFGENFLVIMDPSRGSAWHAHLLGEFGRVLDETAFDGIHIDQYGAPKVGRDAQGARVDLAGVFPQFIDDTAALVREKRGPAGATLFNAVGNWPIETVAPSAQDAVYIEVWKPYSYFMDFHRLIVEAQQLGSGKPVIIAAYIPPDNLPAVRLANAAIFASGGYHLELGEPGAMLADPYFPKYGRMDDATAALLRRQYDFLVRYEDALGLALRDESNRAAALTIAGVETTTSGPRSKDVVAVIARLHRQPDQSSGRAETFSLVNFMGLATGQWQAAHANGPTALEKLAVSVKVNGKVASVWYATPDQASIAPQTLDFTQAGDTLRFVVPRLEYWTMIVVEYQP